VEYYRPQHFYTSSSLGRNIYTTTTIWANPVQFSLRREQTGLLQKFLLKEVKEEVSLQKKLLPSPRSFRRTSSSFRRNFFLQKKLPPSAEVKRLQVLVDELGQ
jgi:hypothetical protein